MSEVFNQDKVRSQSEFQPGRVRRAATNIRGRFVDGVATVVDKTTPVTLLAAGTLVVLTPLTLVAAAPFIAADVGGGVLARRRLRNRERQKQAQKIEMVEFNAPRSSR